MMKLLVNLALLLSFFQVNGQDKSLPLRIGYYSPFGTNQGVQIGTWVSIDQFIRNDNRTVNENWKLAPRVAYFVLPDIQNNIQIGADIEYGNSGKEAGIYSLISFGLGHIMSFTKYDGLVHLDTGEIENNVRTEHSILPQVSLGLGWNLNNRNGLFLRLSYGRQLSFDKADSSLIGAEIGIQVDLKK